MDKLIDLDLLTDFESELQQKYATIDYVNEKDIAVSEEEGNIIETKDDGIYVPPVNPPVSEEEGNIIEKKEDGIYATAPAAKAEVSKEAGNSIANKDDGIYCSAVSPDELTEVDGNLPTEQQMQEFLDDMSANYIRTDMLTEVPGVLPSQQEIVDLTKQLEAKYITVDDLEGVSPEQVGKTYELTEEHMTAATFNGKPVYMIYVPFIFEVLNKSTTTVANFVELHSIDRVIDITLASAKWNSSSYVGQYCQISNGDFAEVMISSGHLKYFTSATEFEGKEGLAKITYTKTTD